MIWRRILLPFRAVSEARAILLVRCPDRPGIIAAISGFLFQHGANIIDFDQHSTDDDGGVYFTRLEFQTSQVDLPLEQLRSAFESQVGRPFSMTWRLSAPRPRKRVAVLVSRHDHALLELLWTWQRGELPADLPLVISYHPGLKGAVEGFGVRFAHVPNGPDRREAAEARMVELFDGADPYRQAHERGVKIVGATAHYVTEQLDAGPIIEQDVARVSHRDEVEDLKRLGRDLERRVLVRAVRLHCEDRVLVHGNKTVVFA